MALRVCMRLIMCANLVLAHAGHPAECETESAHVSQFLQTEFNIGGTGRAPNLDMAPPQPPDIKPDQPDMTPLQPADSKPDQPDWVPLHWMHVSKCGSGFGNSFLHTPRACPGIAEDFACFGKWGECPGVQELDCPFLSFDGFGSHMSVHPHYEQYKGHLCTMLRQPSQRVLSSWYYALDLNGDEAQRHANALEFAQSNVGLMTKMLTHNGEFTWGHEGEPVTEEDALLAASRIKEGFLFVGMLEDWELSICLFNRMFNMDCMDLQFAKTNPTSQNTLTPKDNSTGFYDESVLEGFVDKYDAVPHQAGQEFFERKMGEYGVSHLSCSSCYAQAGLAA